MTDFTRFALWPGAELAPEWLDWLGMILRAEGSIPASPPADASTVLPALGVHGLLPVLYLALRDSPAWTVLPVSFQNALVDAFQTNAVRSHLMDMELVRITGALAAGAVPLALLKGAAMGRTVYDSPAARLVNDLDLLVPATHVEAARDTLAGLGYRLHGPFGSGRFGRWQRRYRSELQMVCEVPGRQGLLVEFHWSLVELPYFIDRIPMDEIWEAAQPCQDMPGASLPDPASLLLHSCAHLALHHSRSLRLIWLVDVDHLARSEVLAWDVFLDRADRWGLCLAAKTTLEAASAWLDTPLPAHAMVRLGQRASDPVNQAMWGLGDERPGRAASRLGHLDGFQRPPAHPLRGVACAPGVLPAVRGHEPQCISTPLKTRARLNPGQEKTGRCCLDNVTPRLSTC